MRKVFYPFNNTKMSDMSYNNYLFNRSFLLNQRKDYCEVIRSNYSVNYLAANRNQSKKISYKQESAPLAENNCCIEVKEITEIKKRVCFYCIATIRKWKRWLIGRKFYYNKHLCFKCNFYNA